MTLDIDLATKKGRKQKTAFGIHGMSYGANWEDPIDITAVIQRAIKRRFYSNYDSLTPKETVKVYHALSKAYSKAVKKYGGHYVGSDVSWLDLDERQRDNIYIVQRLLFLLGQAVVEGRGTVFT